MRFEFTPTMGSASEIKAFTIPESELSITFARSGGPGGQKVNKTNSKAVLKWNVGASAAFNDEQKALIRTKLVNRINTEGEVVIHNSEERSQGQNREGAIRTLNELVARALQVDAERVATRPSRGSKERRMDEKTKEGRKKQGRGGNWGHED